MEFWCICSTCRGFWSGPQRALDKPIVQHKLSDFHNLILSSLSLSLSLSELYLSLIDSLSLACLRLDLCRGVRLDLCDVLAHWPAHGAGVAAVRPAPAVARVDVRVVRLLRSAIPIVLLNGCAAVRWLEISLHITHRAPKHSVSANVEWPRICAAVSWLCT